MLWLILLTLHREVEIVLSVCSTSQENKNNAGGQTKGSRRPASCVCYGSDLAGLALLQALESQATPTSDSFLAK